ncbi:hypothetical protein M514_07240 [Trichuris suis]|uniref:Uncharacterized protein n=1 Tax=Trichuris suis TaxID=68888 RepID=A0A085N1G6_9BILA|nr:hypothetical protein M513_07240 [Trichuris suis]KFD63312.1 hypothetical protein M514_07240 [Trichuris suis]
MQLSRYTTMHDHIPRRLTKTRSSSSAGNHCYIRSIPQTAPSDYHLFASAQHACLAGISKTMRSSKIGWFNSLGQRPPLLRVWYPAAAKGLLIVREVILNQTVLLRPGLASNQNR